MLSPLGRREAGTSARRTRQASSHPSPSPSPRVRRASARQVRWGRGDHHNAFSSKRPLLQIRNMKLTLCLITALAFATLAAVSNAQSPATGATFIDSNKVAAAFARGRPLLENSAFKVHASRRDAPGVVDSATPDTD